jgi:hypothetical protein
MFATVSIKKNSCPIGYKNKDQVISSRNAATAAGRRAPDPGLKKSIWFFQDHQWKQRHNPSFKPQATSVKHQAPIFKKRQALQETNDKRQVPSSKRQASSL